MATAANKLKCGGMKGKAKGKAKGGLVEDSVKGSAVIKNSGPFLKGYPIGTALSEIYNFPKDSSEQEKLMATQSTKDALNRTRWANFEGKLTNYPQGHTVPSFRYTPAMLKELKKRGMDRNYIESWQPGNYTEEKSYQYGGEVYNPGTYDKMPGTAAEASQVLGLGTEISGSTSGDGMSSVIGEGIGMVTELGVTAFDESKKKLALNFDARENPLGDIEKSNKLDTGKAMLKGAAKGAAIGATLGPVTAAIGAAAGTLISGLGRLIGKKNRDAEATEAVKDWSAVWTSKAASHAQSSGYKDGGEIKGPGGPESDSIKMKTEDGSFIVPAENKELGMSIGKTYLGWNDDSVASRNNGGSGIKVSDGELLYTPEEVGILRYHGINLDELAPNAKTKNKSTMAPDKKSFAKGGWKYDSKKELVVDEVNSIAYDKDGNEYTKDTSGELSLSSNTTAVGKSIWSRYGKDGVPELEKPIDQADPDKEAGEFNRKWFDYVPELAGTIQTLGGVAGLMEAGKKPDRMVSATLQKLSSETRRLSSYGYEPSVLNALDTQIEKTRRDVSKSITSRGGSPQQVMAQLQSVLSTTIDKKAGVVFANAKEKARKWSDVLRVDSAVAGQEFDINKLKVEDWYKTQDVFAEMLSAGISNIVGARQLKNEQDLMRKIGTANPTFTRT